MSIRPDDGDSVVSLPGHVGGEHVFRDLVNLKDLPPIYFIDAPRTLAIDAQLIGVDHLNGLFTFVCCISLKNDLALYRVVSRLSLRGPVFVQITYLLVYFLCDLLVCLHDWDTLG